MTIRDLFGGDGDADRDDDPAQEGTDVATVDPGQLETVVDRVADLVDRVDELHDRVDDVENEVAGLSDDVDDTDTRITRVARATAQSTQSHREKAKKTQSEEVSDFKSMLAGK